MATTAPPDTIAAATGTTDASQLRIFVIALFFIFGGITSLNDVIIPKLKELFTLSYAQAMLVQSAFFGAYFVISIPAAALVRRVGYMRAAVAGLVTMTLGCLLFVPAAFSATFVTFLIALFILAAGITIVQVVANPLICLLGPPSSAHSRLTFAQAFNSLGTTVFPWVGSSLILGSLATVDQTTLDAAALDAYRAVESRVVSNTYVGLALALAVVAIAVWRFRRRLVEGPPQAGSTWRAFELLSQRRFGFGALCIFLYVGAEVAIGSIIVNYLEQSSVMSMSEKAAGQKISLYWGGAMLGRFIGAYLLRIFSPGKVLACAAAMVIALLTLSAQSTGAVSGYSLLAIGLFNSIMFPTIFALASEGLGRRAAEGSGVICVAIVGGAIVPLITGFAADIMGLKAALIVPACCYGVILAFGWYARRPHKSSIEPNAGATLTA